MESPDNSSTHAFPCVEGLEVLELLGSGAGSNVFKARQKVMDRIVALKVMKLDSLSPNSLSRFKKEAKICCTLDHPGMARTLAYGIADDGKSPYMVVEYCPGKTLAEHLRAGEKFSGHQISALILQLLDVLGYAHSNNIVHRDLKPENIMLLPGEAGSYQVKLLDFGIARLLEPDDTISGSSTNTNSILGTPVYMSPEQCLSRPTDERSDLYSLSAILYELLYGRPVLEAANPLELLYKKSHEDLQIDRSERSQSQLGTPMLDLLESSLSRNPADRPANASEYRRQFAKAMGSMQAISSKNLSELLSAPQPAVKNKSRVVLLILLLLVTASGLIVFQIQRNSVIKSTTEFSAAPKHSSVKSFSPTHDMGEAESLLNKGKLKAAIAMLQAALKKTNSADERVQVLLALGSAAFKVSAKEAEPYYIDAEAIIDKQHVSKVLAASVYCGHSHVYYGNRSKLPVLKELLAKAAECLKDEDSPQLLLEVFNDQVNCLILENKYKEAADVLDRVQHLQRGFSKYAAKAVLARIEAITLRYHGNPRTIEKNILDVAKEIKDSTEISSDLKVENLANCAHLLRDNPGSSAPAWGLLISAQAYPKPRAEIEIHLLQEFVYVSSASNNEDAFKASVDKLVKIKSRLTMLAVNQCSEYALKPERARYMLESCLANWNPDDPESNGPAIAIMSDLGILNMKSGKLLDAKKNFEQLIAFCDKVGSIDMPAYAHAKEEMLKLKQNTK